MVLITGTHICRGKSNLKSFNTALTAAQVADLYNNPEKVVPTGVDNTALKLWLPMQEGAGTTAYDGSGNGNHGTISGATYTHGIGAPVSQTAVIDWNKGTNLINNNVNLSSFGTNQGVTVLDNQSGIINNTNEVSLITVDSLNSSHRVYGSLTSNSAIHSTALRMKANGISKVVIFFNGSNQGAIFDFTTGTASAFTKYNTTEVTNLTMTDEGNGVYYCGFTTLSSSFATAQIQLYNSTTIPDSTWTGDNTSGVYVSGFTFAQTEELPIIIPTIGTAQTSDVLLPQGLTTGRDITGVNLFENVRKQGALNLDGNSWAEVHDNGSLDFGTGSFSLRVGKVLNETRLVQQ